VRHEARRPADTIPLRGGHPALDFVNTAGWHASETPKEWLADYGELAGWAAHAGLVAPAEADALRARAAAAPAAAARALARATELREALYRVCQAFMARAEPAPADLALVDAARAESADHARLAPTPTGYVLGWDDPVALDAPYWRLGRAAAELLTGPDLPRLRQCESAPCGWLFLDRSRNATRRWCSSEECGNRERVRRHVARR